MPVMVGIHGIGQQHRGANELRSIWLPSVRDGLEAAGHRQFADALSEEDLRVCFFGNLFRPKGAMGTDLPPYTAGDLTSEREIGLLTELYDQAVAQEPALGSPQGALGVRVRVQVMVERLLRSSTFATLISERILVGSLKQVIRYLDNPDVKDQVLERVHKEIDDCTRALIGHSLGSVVAYEYLCRYQPAGVELLVTLGSPLGIRKFIFDRLTPTPTSTSNLSVGVWPGRVSRWVNVADPNDFVALRKDLAPLFPRPDGHASIDDRLIDVGGFMHHEIGPYLNAEETGGALAAVL